MVVCIALLFGGDIKAILEVHITGSFFRKGSKPCFDICYYSPEEQHQLRRLWYQTGDRIVHTLTVKYFEAILEMYTQISGPH